MVHHASDLTWFEEGRSEFLREQGCFYSDIERDGFFVVVAGWRSITGHPHFTRMHQRRNHVGKGQGRLLEFSSRAINQKGVLVAEGRTRHLVRDRERRLVSLPNRYLQPLFGEGP